MVGEEDAGRAQERTVLEMSGLYDDGERGEHESPARSRGRQRGIFQRLSLVGRDANSPLFSPFSSLRSTNLPAGVNASTVPQQAHSLVLGYFATGSEGEHLDLGQCHLPL